MYRCKKVNDAPRLLPGNVWRWDRDLQSIGFIVKCFMKKVFGLMIAKIVTLGGISIIALLYCCIHIEK
jgi:hypothetical protein